MSLEYKVKVMPAKKLLDRVRAESEGDASIILRPTGYMRLGIRPYEITQKTRVGNVLKSIIQCDECP